MPAGGGTAGPSRSCSSCPGIGEPVDVAIVASVKVGVSVIQMMEK